MHRQFTGQIKSATISQSANDKYYVSFLTESEHEEIPHTTKSVGLILGADSCVTSDGKEYVYAQHVGKDTKRLAQLQKQLKRKEKKSNNYDKLKKEIAFCHEQIANAAKDNLHKISHEIISENQVIVSGTLRTHNKTDEYFALSNELLKLLEYKAKWNNRRYVKTDTCTIGALSCTNDDSFNNLQNAAKHILTTGLNQMA